MKFTPKNLKQTKKFQQGGELDPQATPMEQAPVEQAPVQNPMAILFEGAAQALQSQDCQMAMQVCQMLVELAQQSAPQPEQGEPVFRKGGVLSRRLKK